MKTKLDALTAELELLRETHYAIYDSLMKELDVIINKWFVNTPEARCLRRWIRESLHNSVEICFEIVFFNSDKNEIDFGSDMFFEYSLENTCLRENHGTCGMYSKTDVYQVRRIQNLAHVWNNIDAVEQELCTFAERVLPILLDYNRTELSIESEIYRIHKHLEEDERKTIENQLLPEVTLCYSENCSLHAYHRLFSETCTITKVTPKYVTLTSTNSVEYRIKKEKIVTHIQQKHIEVQEII